MLSKKREEDIEEASVIIKEESKPLLEDWKVLLPKLIEMIVPQKVDSQTILKRLKEVCQMQDLSKQIEAVSIDLQTGNERKAMEQFQGIIDRLSDMIHLLQEVKISFGLDYRAIQVKDQTVEQRSEELDELLSEIITAFENEDLVMLADLLEYELSPLLSRWEEVIAAITVEVEKKIN